MRMSMTPSLMEVAEIKNFAAVWLTVAVSLCYSYSIPRRFPGGKRRLVSLLPVTCIFSVLPFFTTSAFFTGVSAFFLAWLANFKLLLFAFDQGPISSASVKSLPIFIAVATLPIKLKRKSGPSSAGKPRKLPLNLSTEIPIFAAILSVLGAYRERIRHGTLLIAYCCLLFLLIEILVGLSGLFIRAVFGLELEPASDEPYLSTSVREFWGRRWNLAVNEIIREAVYRPVRSSAAALIGFEWAAVPAAIATFLVSGFMHELLLWYVTRAAPSWEMTMFFVVQGAFVVAEFALAKMKLTIPCFIGWPATLGFVMATSFWLFFPPLIRNGVDARLLEEFQSVVEKGRQFGPLMGRFFTSPF